MKKAYINPDTQIVAVVVEQLLDSTSSFAVQEGSKGFSNSLSRSGSNWDDED